MAGRVGGATDSGAGCDLPRTPGDRWTTRSRPVTGACHGRIYRSARDGSVDTPLVFAHRGASGDRTEHTLAAYALAIRLGADVNEPDLASTEDRVLVARHENEVCTTDVSERREFAGRRTTKRIDGVAVTGWFNEDFTPAELRSLRAVERLPDVRPENTIDDGRYFVPTFQQVIDMAQRMSRETGRQIGLTPETKHPTCFDRTSRSLEEPLGQRHQAQRPRPARLRHPRAVLRGGRPARAGPRARGRPGAAHQPRLDGPPYDHVVPGDPETYAQMTTRRGLGIIARYADALGPEKTQIFPRDSRDRALTPTSLVSDAHDRGLLVVPHTFRAENVFLPTQYDSSADENAFGDLFGEIEAALQAGVDGLLTDHTDIGVIARDEFLDR